MQTDFPYRNLKIIIILVKLITWLQMEREEDL